jgi:hypothetical protein
MLPSKSIVIKNLFFIYFLFFISSSLQAQHVYFGERNLEQHPFSLCFDQEGNIYPDYYIADSALQNCNHNLNNWYQTHPIQLSEICKIYGIDISLKEFNINQLNDSISSRIAGKINQINSHSVTFLVHGYRKSFEAPEGTVTSVIEFDLLEKNTDSLGLKSHFVEVYWDGTYDCCFSVFDKKRNAYLFSQFENAQIHAPNVGIALRKIVNQVKNEHINFIGHSLGSKVVASTLFNLKQNNIQTPHQKDIRVCLIAPAIGGIESFENYWNRNTSLNFKEKDNYSCYILYNEKDFALRKKDSKMGIFGPGCVNYGNTTLGCNHQNEIEKLQRLFNKQYPKSTIKFENMTWMGKKHSLKYYAEGNILQSAVQFLND